jgi:hypothetical protein
MSYVQPRSDLFRIVTPFLRLNVSYRRVHSVHPAEFHKLYPPAEASWGERRFLRPFYGQTAVVVKLFDYPLHRRFLRFFLPPHMFDPTGKGFVFLVSDWMALSREMDNLRGQWGDSNRPERFGRGLFGP